MSLHVNPNNIGLQKCPIGYWMVYAPNGWGAYPAVSGRRFWIPTKHLAWKIIMALRQRMEV